MQATNLLTAELRLFQIVRILESPPRPTNTTHRPVDSVVIYLVLYFLYTVFTVRSVCQVRDIMVVGESHTILAVIPRIPHTSNAYVALTFPTQHTLI